MPDAIRDYDRARQLLEIYRGEADDFFKLWPRDKQFFFSDDGKGFISYGIQHHVAICMGDPVGAPDSIKPLLEAFTQYCSDNKLTAAFIQTTNRYQRHYQAIGLRSLLIGADAVIQLDGFAEETMHNKYFRNLENRFLKNDYRFEIYSPPHSQKLLSELREISESWLSLPHRKEWSFLTGRFDDDYLQQVAIYVLRDADGVAQAFANDLPSYKPGVATIDLMRHRADAPANSIDMLFTQLFLRCQQQGYSSFNLGLSPLDGQPFITGFAARSLMFIYRISDSFIGFRGLHQFKSKYEPQWEPRYVWFQGGTLSLQPIGVAVVKLLTGS